MMLDLNGKETVGFDRTKVECCNCHMRGHFTRDCKAPRDHGNRNRDAPTRNKPVDTSTTNALYDQQRETLNKSNLEIIGYQIGLESLEARIVVHEKNEAVFKEDIAFLKYDVQVKDISIKDFKNQLEDALKEKDDLKLKLEKFEITSKNLTKLIDSQISATDKTGLGYDGHVNKSEMLNNVVDILTKSRKVPVNTAKQSSQRVATSVSTAMHVNTTASRPNVNSSLPSTYSYFKAHSPVKQSSMDGFDEMMTTEIRKGISGIITPLFKIMMVQAPEEVGEGSKVPTDTHHTPIVTQPSSSQPHKKKNKGGNKGRKLRRMNEEDMFGVNDLDGDEVIMDTTVGEEVGQSTKLSEKELLKMIYDLTYITTASEVVTIAEDVEVTTTATNPQISKDELTLAQTLIEIKAAKTKARGVIVQEPSEFRTTSSSQPSQLPQAKDKEVARKLEAQMKAEMEEEERISREKDEANIALQTKEQEQLTDAEKARLFMEFLEKRRKFFIRKREIEKRNIPPTKAQQRIIMCTYIKNMDGWKPKNLKKKLFNEIQKLFDLVMKRVNTFVDMNTEIVEEMSKKTQAEVTEGISKREGDALEQESAKRKRADGNSQSYLTFGKMFKNFNREDLEVLWSIVKERFKKTKPVDDIDNLLCQTSKTMFEHHAEDNTWRYQQGIAKVLN
nr:hypothetical protein [Tanacetum cinerariifolium]